MRDNIVFNGELSDVHGSHEVICNRFLFYEKAVAGSLRVIKNGNDKHVG